MRAILYITYMLLKNLNQFLKYGGTLPSRRPNKRAIHRKRLNKDVQNHSFPDKSDRSMEHTTRSSVSKVFMVLNKSMMS